MKQWSLASQALFEKYGRKSRREQFLDEMEQVVPWSGLQGSGGSALREGGQRPAAGGAFSATCVECPSLLLVHAELGEIKNIRGNPLHVLKLLAQLLKSAKCMSGSESVDFSCDHTETGHKPSRSMSLQG